MERKKLHTRVLNPWLLTRLRTDQVKLLLLDSDSHLIQNCQMWVQVSQFNCFKTILILIHLWRTHGLVQFQYVKAWPDVTFATLVMCGALCPVRFVRHTAGGPHQQHCRLIVTCRATHWLNVPTLNNNLMKRQAVGTTDGTCWGGFNPESRPDTDWTSAVWSSSVRTPQTHLSRGFVRVS